MKKIIKIKCRLYNSINAFSYHVLVYNSSGKLIIDDYTDKMGNIDCYFPYFGIYKIIINDFGYYNKKRCIILFINKKTPEELLIVNTPFIKKSHKVNINLTDQNYKGLPIVKGEIILWEKNI